MDARARQATYRAPRNTARIPPSACSWPARTLPMSCPSWVHPGSIPCGSAHDRDERHQRRNSLHRFHAAGGDLAIRLLRHGVCDGDPRRHHPAYRIGAVDGRMAAIDRRHPTAERIRLGGCFRQIPPLARVPKAQLLDGPCGVQGDLLDGVCPPSLGPSHRRGVLGPASLFLGSAAARSPADGASFRPLVPGRPPRCLRLVHGQKRSRRPGRREPSPPCRASRSGVFDLRLHVVARPRTGAEAWPADRGIRSFQALAVRLGDDGLVDLDRSVGRTCRGARCGRRVQGGFNRSSQHVQFDWPASTGPELRREFSIRGSCGAVY